MAWKSEDSFSIPGRSGARDFSFLQNVQFGSEAHTDPSSTAKEEAARSPIFIAEVKNGESVSLLPFNFIAFRGVNSQPYKNAAYF